MIVPNNFDGSKFSKKYNLDVFDFWVRHGELFCPSLPNLTDNDLLDCVNDVGQTVVSPSQQIILADGEDVAIVTIRGESGATVDYTINGQAQSLTLDDSGTDTLELTCDTPNTTLLVQAGTAQAVIYAVGVLA